MVSLFLLLHDAPVQVRGIPGRPLRGARDRRRLPWWSDTAQAEMDAAMAFERLAWEIGRHGAPASLVERCVRAAAQERTHAALAVRQGGEEPHQRMAPRRLPSLAQLAVENLQDGVLGETVNVAHAQAEARLAPPRERAVLERIASDERDHADLGEAIVRWCARTGGAPVRRTLGAYPLRAIQVRPLRTGPGPAALRGWVRARALQLELSGPWPRERPAQPRRAAGPTTGPARETGSTR